MNGHFPIPKRKSHQAATRWLLKILRFTFANPTPYKKVLNKMTISSPHSKRNAILGVTGDGVRLAKSHVNQMQKLFLETPTYENFKKYQAARKRQADAIFAANQQKVLVLV